MPTALVVLRNYFNDGPDAKPLKAFVAELKELSPDEKAELAQLAAADMGVELTEK